MNNDDIPSIDDAIKEFESKSTPVTPPVMEEESVPEPTPVMQETSTPEVNNTQAEPVHKMPEYNIDGKTYHSLTEMMEEQERNSVQNEPNRRLSKEEYVEHFIGDKYESFKNGGISFAYFFFGEYYLIFRKLIGPAILKYILSVGILAFGIYSYFVGNGLVFVSLIAYVLLQLIPIFILKRYYYNYAQRKVDMILEANPETPNDELIKIISAKGGTSIIGPIVLFVLLIVLRNFINLPQNQTNADFSINQGETERPKNLSTYEIEIRDLHTLSTNYLGLEEKGFNNQTKIVESECKLRITTRSTKNGYNIDTGGVKEETVTINDYEWRHLDDDDKDAYIAEYKDYLYAIESEIVDNNEKCSKSIKILIDNLKFE